MKDNVLRTLLNNLSKQKKTVIIVLIVILSFFVMVLLHHTVRGNRLPFKTSLIDHEVGGMDYDEFNQFIFNTISTRQAISVVYEDQYVELILPKEIYENISSDLWDQVYIKTRGSNWLHHMLIDIKSLFVPERISLAELSFDVLDNLDIEYLYDNYNLSPVYQGKVAYVGGRIVIDDPVPGAYIFQTLFKHELMNLLLHSSEISFELPVSYQETKFSKQQIEGLASKLESLLSTKRILTHAQLEGREYSLTSDDLHALIVASYSFDSNKFVIGFNNEFLDIIVQRFMPQDAQIVITDNYLVEIKQEIPGVVINPEELRQLIRDDFNDPKNTILLLNKGSLQLPKKTTDAYSYTNLNHVVSEFTTYHSCCAARVENIHIIADLLDEKVLAPGEILDVNELIGERTVEKGFKPAGSIFKGELVDSVGGGISQFITTLHNTVYWGGYEIITHKPHSIYFSRYPKGIEATINWPYVDYVFRNDTEDTIMIDTEYSDTSITVRILGDNSDRVFIGDHRGQTWKNIVRTSKSARKVISYVSAPYNYREPLVRYISDSSIARGEQDIDQRGGQGWSVLVERTVLQNNQIIHYDKKPVHYLSDKDTIIRVHPCDNPSAFDPSCYSQ